MEMSRNESASRKTAAIAAAALAAALSAGFAGQALAEEPSIEEIVVTAQKRDPYHDFIERNLDDNVKRL